jgi:hypothetical protein
MRIRLLLLLTVALSFYPWPAQAMRCGNQLVLEGMSRYEVRKRCGNPADESRYYRTVYRQNAINEAVAIEIEIEEWIYDFGSNKFARRLIFVNGRLQDEELVD